MHLNTNAGAEISQLFAKAENVQHNKISGVHPAGNVGVDDLAVVFVDQLVQATSGTAVAQRFPFLGRHLVESLALPEGGVAAGVHGHDARSMR